MKNIKKYYIIRLRQLAGGRLLGATPGAPPLPPPWGGVLPPRGGAAPPLLHCHHSGPQLDHRRLLLRQQTVSEHKT